MALPQVFLSSAPRWVPLELLPLHPPEGRLLSRIFETTGGDCICLAWPFFGWTTWNSILVGHKWSDIGSFSGSTLHIWGTLNIYNSALELEGPIKIVQLSAFTGDRPWAGPGLPIQWSSDSSRPKLWSYSFLTNEVKCAVNCQASEDAGLKGLC